MSAAVMARESKRWVMWQGHAMGQGKRSRGGDDCVSGVWLLGSDCVGGSIPARIPVAAVALIGKAALPDYTPPCSPRPW
jgi:hypothetical protein